MANETLILSPLIDRITEETPAAPVVETGGRCVSPDRWRESLLSHADPQGFALISYGDLVTQISLQTGHSEQLLYDNPWMVKNHLELAGITAAPDATLERRKLKSTDNVVVYSSDTTVPPVRHRNYKKGLLLVKYLTLAFQPLDPHELAVAERYISEWTRNARYAKHLQGLLRWYDSRRRLLDVRTRRAHGEILTTADKRLLARQLLEMGASRGMRLSRKSVCQLDRLLSMLDYRPGEVHRMLHRVRCHSSDLRPLSTPSTSPVKSQTDGLDSSLLARIEQDTAKVQLLLAETFSQPEEDAPESSRESGCNAEMQLLKSLSARGEWSVEEADSLREAGAPPLGVMIERINALSTDTIGDTVIDREGDTLYITTQYAEKLWKETTISS